MNPAELPTIAGDPWAIGTFVVYFLAIVAIGVLATRFSSSAQANFLLGGRKMKTLVVALSAVVSGRSAWLLLAVSGVAFLRGASAIWMVAGYTVAELILFRTVARRLRRDTEAKGDITIPDYLASRYGDRFHLLRTVAVLIIVVFMVTYIGAQIVAGGKALGATFGIQDWIGALITGGIILIYTTLGGFLAVSLVDAMQAFIMIFALVGLPLMAMLGAGGSGEIVAALNPAMLDPFALTIGLMIGWVGIGLGSPGNPHILVRYMSIENEAKLKRAGWIGFFWNCVMGVGAVSIGVIGRAIYKTREALPGADEETIFPTLAGHLPPLLFGLVIAAIFAAIMSTADSQLLVAASAAIRDFYQRIVRGGRELPERRMVMLNRLAVVVLCIVGILISIFGSQYINFLVLLAWTGLGCSFGPPVVLGLYWKRCSRWGALAGMLAGAATTFIWGLNPGLKAIVHEIVPAFFASLVFTIVVSLLTFRQTEIR
ncbi:MAG TPA: sodium/proline symporter [Acidobacteriota bacterium]|nr:sodium/proline symporter [Acidobacteriota bacterium]